MTSKGELLAGEMNAEGLTPYWPEGDHRWGNWEVSEVQEHPEGADRGGFVPTYTDVNGTFSDWQKEEHEDEPDWHRPRVDTTGGTAYFCVHNEQWLGY